MIGDLAIQLKQLIIRPQDKSSWLHGLLDNNSVRSVSML